MRKRKFEKVFFVGMGRTGNRSLCHAMWTLGYTVKRYPRNMQDSRNYDVVSDNPVCLVWDFLESVFPKAAFVLNCRDPETWIDSAWKHGSKRVKGLFLINI